MSTRGCACGASVSLQRRGQYVFFFFFVLVRAGTVTGLVSKTKYGYRGLLELDDETDGDLREGRIGHVEKIALLEELGHLLLEVFLGLLI